MKKYLLLLLIACTGLASCKKETFITEPLNRTILVDIAPNKWVLSANRLEYSTVINIPENNVNFNHSGGIIVAMSFEDADEYDALPHLYTNTNDNYRFTSRPGSLTILLSNLNGVTPIPPDGLVTAKITLVDANLID